MKDKDLKDIEDAVLTHGLQCAAYTNTHTDAFEIFISGKRRTVIDISRNQVTSVDGMSFGIGIRVSINGKLGYASSSDLTHGAIKHMVQDAVKMARGLNFNDERFSGFAHAPATKGKDGIISMRILSLDEEDAVGIAKEIYADSLSASGKVVTSDVNVTREYGVYAVVNSEGVEEASRFAYATAECYTTVSDGDERKTGSSFEVTRRSLKGEIGREAADRALMYLGAEHLRETRACPCILENRTAGEFFFSVFYNSINGRAVVEERSPFAGRLGDDVAAGCLSVTDDGQMPDAVSTSCIDAEGVPMQEKKVIDRGVLKSFLFDTYFGNIFGSKSTGNAFRSGHAPHTRVPSILPSTLVISKGNGSPEDLISEVDYGIYISGDVMGLGHANFITGDFSIVALTPMLIRKGSIQKPLQPLTVAGNMYKSLRDIIRVGSDSRLGYKVSSPCVLIDGFTVSG